MNAITSNCAHQVQIAIAIPICNEAAVIERCLMALAAQTFTGSFTVFGLLNNCTDATAKIIRQIQPRLPYRLCIHERWFNTTHANAGVARRAAMQQAARKLEDEGLLLTTDADTRAAPDWIAETVAEMTAGADAVAGMAIIDPRDAAALPARLIKDEAETEAYATILDEIAWLLDREDADPWPRHTQHSGASIAVRADWYRRVGGMPSIPLGEDRQFFAELRRADAKIRHARNVTVTVSGRTSGRARGGMADTIFRRMLHPDEYLDEQVEPAEERARRMQMRAAFRAQYGTDILDNRVRCLSTALRVPTSAVQQSLTAGTFGRGWEILERASPLLRRDLVLASDLNREMRIARRIVERIRLSRRSREREHQADTAAFVAAE